MLFAVLRRAHAQLLLEFTGKMRKRLKTDKRRRFRDREAVVEIFHCPCKPEAAKICNRRDTGDLSELPCKIIRRKPDMRRDIRNRNILRSKRKTAGNFCIPIIPV